MTELQATAPGKVILFGEHAVVYGRPAIAVPVTKVQAVATLRPLAAGAGFRIVAPELGRTYLLSAAPPQDALARIVRLGLAHLQQESPPPAELVVTSSIPLGRGLGSGAAISAAIVRVLARFYDQSLAPGVISDLVYEVEKLYHGTPSGIDNTVIAFEQPVYFIKGRPLQRMEVARPFSLVVGDTGVVARTDLLVGQLRERWQAAPERYEGYFDEMGVIARQARQLIERGQPGLVALGKLMNENQALLAAVGVSSPALERLILAARQAGAVGAKLSGAGGGGTMIALVPEEPAATRAVMTALREAGATAVIVTQVS